MGCLVDVDCGRPTQRVRGAPAGLTDALRMRVAAVERPPPFRLLNLLLSKATYGLDFDRRLVFVESSFSCALLTSRTG
jgi:hypothetical protein